MFKYKKHDLLWLAMLVLANIGFYIIGSVFEHYFMLNFVAIITMLGVGTLKYKLDKSQKGE
ncbi:hypothetical protein LCGC14_0374850 [marine sediment metagenome]|uniref:Uncharacterized protein n=1 Tax=marine sediment metagenome TaxID=412755 RepID=A0A0F9T4A3_9ZZZZ